MPPRRRRRALRPSPSRLRLNPAYRRPQSRSLRRSPRPRRLRSQPDLLLPRRSSTSVLPWRHQPPPGTAAFAFARAAGAPAKPAPSFASSAAPPSAMHAQVAHSRGPRPNPHNHRPFDRFRPHHRSPALRPHPRPHLRPSPPRDPRPPRPRLPKAALLSLAARRARTRARQYSSWTSASLRRGRPPFSLRRTNRVSIAALQDSRASRRGASS
jgi:hypothetical protein